MALSSTASSSTTRTPASTARNHSEARAGGGSESCYFPGCRKDANCHCEICIESFNATRDLHSALRFPPKKNKSKNRPPPSTVDPFTPPSTPESVSTDSIITRSPPIKSTAKSRPKERSKEKKKKKSWVVGYKFLLLLVGIWVLLSVDLGVFDVVFKRFRPKLGMKMVKEFGEEAKILEMGLKERLGAVERRVKQAIGEGKGGVSNCSSSDSLWKLNQEEGHNLFFQWRCVIYRSMAEELSVWGSPLQTSGILTAGACARSLTLLSGRMTQWSEGKPVPTSRTSNGSSWAMRKWSSAAVQLEGETWVLEYRTSALFQGTGLIRSAREILSMRMQTMTKKLKRRLIFGRCSYCRSSRERQQFKHPT